MQDAGDEFAERARHPCVHQISMLLLLRRQSAPALRLGCSRLAAHAGEKGPGRGGGSRLKSTLFMGPGHKGFNSDRQRRSQNCLLCAGRRERKKAAPES